MLVKVDLLVLDDWGPDRLSASQRRDLMEIVEDRHGRGSLLITSQLPLATWHEVIGEPTLGDAILDQAAGIDPKDIDYLIPSHAHIDHIGGILAADGSRNFPNAQIFISQADLEPATGVSRREFRALTEVPTFPEVGGQESGLWGGNSGVSRRRRRNSERVSAR
jgi:glyoxylase-like metal-dependent hydrolase (beta-lactamase superfamily II)